MSGQDVATFKQGRSALLDCIRAIAITMVVFFHVAVEYPGTGGAFERFFMTYGSKGVDIFFPLSGMLICSFLMQSRRPDFIKIFFLRRVFRILPLYLVMVTLAGVAMYVTGQQVWLLDRLWINYTFLTAWFIHFQGPETVPYTITWSLSVEEFAYILFGLVALASRRALPWVLGFLAIAPFFIKYWYAINDGGFYFLPLARIDSIAIGGVAAWLIITDRRPILWLSVALAATTALSLTDPHIATAMRLTQLALATGLVMAAIQLWWRDVTNPLIKMGASIGFYSYFTYLFHVFVIAAAFKILPHMPLGYPPFWLVSLICLVLTHMVAWASYRWFEGPMLQFGRKFEGRGTPAPEASLPGTPSKAVE